jgi:hypothetical protein
MMEWDDIHHLMKFFTNRNIIFCFVGELALNYYNVPRVVHVPIPNSVLLILLLTAI